MPSLTYDRLQQPNNQTISARQRTKPAKSQKRKSGKINREGNEKVDSKEESVYSRLNVPTMSRKNKIITRKSSKRNKSQEGNNKQIAMKTETNKKLPRPPNTGLEGEIEISEQELRKFEKASERELSLAGSKNDNRLRQMAKESAKQKRTSNNVSKYLDTNKVESALRQMGFNEESQRFHKLIKHRFKLEEDFIEINQNVGIQTVEGDYDECASIKHSAIGGLKVKHIPKKFIMVDEYDPKILVKNLNVLKDLEKRTIAIHRKGLQEQM